MNQAQQYRPFGVRHVVAPIIALLAGISQPFWIMMQIAMPLPSLAVMSLLAVILFAWAGRIPAILLYISSCVSCLTLYGAKATLVIVPLCILPSILAIHAMRAQKPFFQQLTLCVAANMAGAVAAFALASLLFGGDMIAQFISMIHTEIQGIIPDAMPEIVGLYGSQLSQLGLSATPTVAEVSSAIESLFLYLRMYYEIALPGNLLATGLVTGVLSAGLGNWIFVRRGEAGKMCFVPLAGWHMPSNMSLGLLLAMIIGIFLGDSVISGMAAAWNAVYLLAEMAFSIQALASIDRNFVTKGHSGKRRTWYIVLIVAIVSVLGLNLILAFIGIASALFGHRGAIRLWFEGRKNEEEK